jgi:uncharacterized delta-60 repeat protein
MEGATTRRIAPRRRGALVVVAASAVLVLAGLALGAAGDLDPGFDGDGRVTIDYGGADRANDVLVQPDGKVVTAGAEAAGMQGTFQVSRLNAGGALDIGFGNVSIDFARAPDQAAAVARQPDGRLVVAGQTGDNVAVARLLQDGGLDPSFAAGASGDDLDPADGRLEISYGGSADTGVDGARDVLVQPDGTIVVAGFSVVPEGSNAVLTQLSASGAITGFGNQFIGFNGGAGARAVTRQADGRLVVAGITTGANGSDIAVARILPSTGQPDPSFSPGGADGDGRLVLDLGGSDVAEDAVAQPDGRIVLAGRQQINAQDVLAIRLSADGSRDASFDGDGVARVNAADVESGNAVALQPDGKIVVAGSVGDDHAVVRLQPGGSPDTTFSGDGLQTFGFPGAPSGAALGIALGADGGLVTAGVVNLNGEDVAVARLQGDSAAGGPGGPGATGGPGAGRPPRCGGRAATIVGTPRKDGLRGTRRADVIAGLGGNDTVTALGGDDLVCGGTGKDLLKGGPGRDRLLGQAGNDRLLGGPGIDRLLGQGGRDAMVGGAGPRDLCLGGLGRDAAACERGRG